MLTPKQLYEAYSSQPCDDDGLIFNVNPLYGSRSYGRGTPHYMKRVVQFMRHIKYPCITDTPDYNNILNTGTNQICLAYKFLESLDMECLKEIQPTIKSGTSHAIRNACDISRACYLVFSQQESFWQHRMATEYLQYFGENSLSDCLMLLGPDLVPEDIAYQGRAPNVEITIPLGYKGLGCLPREKDFIGATGATWSCMQPPGITNEPPKCRSCPYCEPSPVEGGGALNPDDPCCKYLGDLVRYSNYCCGAPLTTRPDFGLLISDTVEKPLSSFRLNNVRSIPIANFESLQSILEGGEAAWLTANILPEDANESIEFINNIQINDAIILQNNKIYVFAYPFQGSRWDIKAYEIYTYKMKHVGILPRKIYGGYANLLDNSGSNFYAIIDDLFLEYFQTLNGWDYINNVSTSNSSILRARTISMLSPDVNEAAQSIKDLLWNGYGVVLFSNVGFPNSRDSRGLTFPDRMWYTTYTIIGYDDSRTEFDDCVYILHCPWGQWNFGGHPKWGNLPDGSFLVSEQHLKCMLRVYADRDYYECRRKLCNPVLDDCDDEATLRRLAGCGSHGLEDKCEPYFCASKQSAMGLAFAISLTEGFTAQQLNHTQWLPRNYINETIQEQTLYLRQ